MKLSNPICTFLVPVHPQRRPSHLFRNEDVMRIYTRCAAVQRARGDKSGRRKPRPARHDYSARLCAPVATRGNKWLRFFVFFELVYPFIRRMMALTYEAKVYQGSPKASREGGGTGGQWEGGISAKKTAGLEPIRPGEAPSTCTTGAPGRVPVTRWGIIIITIIYLLSRGRLWGQS